MKKNTFQKINFSLKLIALSLVISNLSSIHAQTGLNFNGSQRVDVGDSVESLQNMTIEAWVYYSSTLSSFYNEIYSKNHVNSLNIVRTPGLEGKIWFHLGTGSAWFDGGAVTSNAAIVPETWTHVAVTWEEATSTVKFYINGVLDKTTTHTHSGGSVMGGNSFQRGIGGYDGGAYYYGSLDEVRAWNVVKTETEIQASMNNPLLGNEANLLAYYDFEDGTGTTLTDRSSNSNDGTLLNMNNSNWVTGQIGSFSNSTPTDITLSSSNIDDDQVSGSIVGSFSSTDVDTGDNHTYTLVSGSGDTDNASFSISGSNLLSATAFDFNTKSSYSIRVRTTDSGNGNLTFEKEFTITINDKTTPVIYDISMVSNSGINSSYAKETDIITLIFYSNETINTPTVTIAGESATVINPSGNLWHATLTVGNFTTEGSAAFLISA